MGQSFLQALASGNLEAVRAFPKADRHCHGIFSAGLTWIEKWAGVTLAKPPSKMAALDDMNGYAHSVLNPYIDNRRGTEFVCETGILDAIDDGVSVLEMSFDVAFIRFYDGKVEPILRFVERLLATYREKIDFRPEIGLARDRDPRTQIPVTLECVDSGLFKSIDLYGNELAQPPEVYKDLYRRTRRRGLKLKAHAGEFGGPDVIESTMNVLDLDEIQHGARAAESPALMRTLAEREIRLNLCPTSNVVLSVAPSLSQHPIRTLVENGVRVSVNTDDLTIFGKSVSEELLGLYQAGTLTAQQLEAVRLDSLRV